MLVATVFAGCRSMEADELPLAAEIGRVLGSLTREVRLGGYNGLMEEVAKHVELAGGRVVAPLLRESDAWGPMNPHVHEVVPCANPSERMDFYLSADLIVALPGGVGALYEIAAALWHTTSYTPIPVWLVGRRCQRLHDLLTKDEWIVRTPTRPTEHIKLLHDGADLAASLRALTPLSPTSAPSVIGPMLLRQLAEAVLNGPVTLPDGRTAEHYFDEYRIMANPDALAACVAAMVPSITAAGPIDGLAGVVSAGLPLATLLSQRLRLPLSVVRSAPRPYGTATAVEGGPVMGRRLLLVDSVLSTGITSLKAARLLRQNGAQVDTLAVMLDRERGGSAALATEGLSVLPLVTWRQLIGGVAD